MSTESPERTLSDETRALLRKAISDAYYNAGGDRLVHAEAVEYTLAAIEPIVVSIDENAHQRGLHSDGALDGGEYHDGVLWGIRHPGPSRKQCPFCVSTLEQGDGS